MEYFYDLAHKNIFVPKQKEPCARDSHFEAHDEFNLQPSLPALNQN
jgi:hypothetical protein